MVQTELETLSIVNEKNWTYKYKEAQNPRLLMVETFSKTIETNQYFVFLRRVPKHHIDRREYVDKEYQIVIATSISNNRYIDNKEKLVRFYEYLNIPHFHSRSLAGPMYAFDSLCEAYDFVEEVLTTLDEIKE